MKVGDLVRLKDYPQYPQAGLIVSIERRGEFSDYWLAKVQWFEDGYIQHRSLKNLEVISESR